MSHVKLFGFGMLMMMLLASTSSAAERTMSVWHSNANVAWQAAKTNRKPLLLFITMRGCSYCEKMNKNTYSNPQVIGDLRQSFVAVSVEVSRYPTLVEKLNVDSFPTTVILSPQGRVLDLIDGYVGPQELRQRLQRVSDNQ